MSEVDRPVLTGLELLFRLGGVGVVQTDLASGRLLRANPAFCATLGYSEAELRGMSYQELTHPEDRARDAANFAAFQRGELSESQSLTRVLRKDGEVVWLELHVTILREAGRAYNITVAHDVSERQRAEAQLRESEARTQLALEVAQLGTWSWNPEHDEVWADRRCREICGLEPHAALRLDDVAARVHPDDWGRVETSLEAVLHPEGTRRYAEEFRLVHPDGRERWVMSRGQAHFNLVDGAERFTTMLGTVRDITRRKEAEAALRASEAQSRTILESITDAFFALGHDWRFTYVNRHAERLLGRPSSDLLGELVWDAYPGLTGSAFEKVYREVAETRTPASVTAFYPDHGRWYEAHAYPATDGLTVYFRNVTGRKETEAALRRSEAQYRMLFNSIDEGFCVIELLFDDAGAPVDYRFLEANPMFEQQTGLSRVVGKTAREVVPSLEPHWFATYGAVALSGEPLRFTDEAKAMGRWFDVYAFRLGGSESRKVALLFTDITERRRAEAEREGLLVALGELNETLEQRVEARTRELQQSEQRFAQAFSAGPIASCITTLGNESAADGGLADETVLEVNEAFTRLTGYSRAEAVGRGYDALGLWSSAHDRAQLAAAQRGGGVRDLELHLRTKAGETRNILLSSDVIRLDGHSGQLRMFYDITRRKQAEAGQALLRQAMDNAEETVVITTAQLDAPGPHIIYTNAAFTVMTGYRPEEVVGQTPRMFQGPKTDRTVLRRMRRRLKVGGTFQGETFNYRKDGTPYVLAWNVAPIRNAQGTLTHYVSIQHDVTERRTLERELLDISAREQRRIAGDLHDALQQHLIGTAMQAKALARSLAARNDDHAAEAEGLYALVLEGVTGLRTVVQGIVPVQASENGLMLALDGLSAKVRDLYGVSCTFVYETPVHVGNFELATQLYYIAQEAAVNAAKHAGASAIEIGLARADRHALLSVRDDGRGFAYRADETPSSGGMGLRLMAYRARLVGAQLEVASQPGGGTTVTCTFEPK
jgi:PAS domain S-box-containing protein